MKRQKNIETNIPRQIYEWRQQNEYGNEQILKIKSKRYKKKTIENFTKETKDDILSLSFYYIF